MKKNILFVLIELICITSLSYSQIMDQRIENTMTQVELLLSHYKNGPYKTLDGVIDIDSSIGKPGISDGNISDPYGTLKHCYLFLATTEGKQGRNEKHSIGIFRDNQIIWMSELLPGSEYYGYLSDQGFLATKDLNKNGMVDIVVYFSDGTNPPSGYYLWIFSWDGKKGNCINKCEKNGRTSIASTGAFDIVDVDDDGIDEIRSYDRDLKINAVYYWNGIFYTEKGRLTRPH